MSILAPNENNFWQRKNVNIDPYVSKIQVTTRSGFNVRAPLPAPILIQQQRSFTNFLFQIDDTDDVDSDVPVEMGLRLGFGPD